jgi:hypothetical protein
VPISVSSAVLSFLTAIAFSLKMLMYFGMTFQGGKKGNPLPWNATLRNFHLDLLIVQLWINLIAFN